MAFVPLTEINSLKQKKTETLKPILKKTFNFDRSNFIHMKSKSLFDEYVIKEKLGEVINDTTDRMEMNSDLQIEELKENKEKEKEKEIIKEEENESQIIGELKKYNIEQYSSEDESSSEDYTCKCQRNIKSYKIDSDEDESEDDRKNKKKLKKKLKNQK